MRTSASPRPPEPSRARQPRRLRGGLMWLHRVLGLTVGLVLVISGLTGASLVFRAEIDTTLNPHLLRVATAPTRAPLQPILDEVARRFPAEPAAARIRMPRNAHGTYEIWLGAAPARYVYADPYRGTILGDRGPTEFLTGWLFLAHSRLLSGELGHTVAGVCALALIVLSLTGVVIWWPRRAPWDAWAQWRTALTVARGRGTKRLTYDLHRVVGFYASLLLCMAGITGASLVFHEAFERGAHLFAGTRATPVRTVLAPSAASTLPADALLAAAERALPGGAISYLYVPTAPGETFRVRKRLPGEQHPNGKTFVHVDPVAGRVVATEDGTRAPLGAKWYSVLYPLHIGALGGTGTRLLAILTGLALPLLAVTGSLVWWRRAETQRRPVDPTGVALKKHPIARGSSA